MKKSISIILTIIILIGAMATVIAGKSPFSDVQTTRWSYETIKYVMDKGYMNGVGDGRFDPAGTMTRGMVVTVLYRREGSPAVTFRNDFSDVEAGKYYSDAVIWAKDEGIVNGITETTFEPNSKITREQLATMLSRFSERCPVFVPERADLSGYPDADRIHSYAQDALAWASEANLIRGMSDGTLSPRGYATREQFATILKRFDDTFTLVYNEPVIRSHYTEKPYPLVGNADIYVAVDGDDGAQGDFEHPLASFAGAVAKVREIKQVRNSGDIIVAFKAGKYSPVELELGPEDGGSEGQRIIYCKYGDGEVVFDNGATLKENDFLPLDEEEKVLFNDRYADNIKKVDIGSALIYVPSYDDFALFSDTGICSIARYPNMYPDGSDQYFQAAETYDADNLHILLANMRRRFDKYVDDVFSEMRIYGHIVRGYRKDTFEIESYDKVNHLLKVGKSSSNEFGGRLRSEWRDVDGQGIRMIVLNVPYELDTAGEYWVDRSTDTLYVYDPSGDYHIPMPHGEKRLRGVENYDTGDGYPAEEGYCAIYAEDTGYITFRGLHFTNNVDEFIIGYKTSGFEIDNCKFDCCIGWNQLLFEYSIPDVPLGLCLTDSEFDLCVGRHVYVFDEAEGPERFTNRSDILVDNCLFTNSNLMIDAEAALNLHHCSGVTVSHNEFAKCNRYAVMFTFSCDVLVEYNDFHSAMMNSDDGGVTRSSSDALGNSVVRYNFYNRIPSGGTAGRMAHYCDNGDCGTLMYSNLLYNAGYIGLSGPAGRDNVLRDNIMIGDATGAFTGSFIVPIIEDGVEKIVVSNGEKGLINSLKNQWISAFGYCETIPGYAEDLIARRPGAMSLITDFDRADDPNFILAPTNTFVGNLFINGDAKQLFSFGEISERYTTVENNTTFTYSENPIFVNPTIGDYRIREGVDFPDIEFEKIGRY